MKRMILIAILAVSMVGVAQADIFSVDLGTIAPPATVGGYAMTAFPDDTRSNYSSVTSVDSPLGGSVDFDITMSLREIGSGWATWSHGYTGDVYFTAGATSVTMTLPAATGAFYFYAEPNPYSVHSITATADDGTILALDVDGSYGARGYGFYTTGASVLSSISVSTDVDFAVGEFGIAAVPVPGAVLLGLLGMSVAGCRLRKKLA